MKCSFSNEDINRSSLTDFDILSLSHNTAKAIKERHELEKGDGLDSKHVRIIGHNSDKMIDRRVHKRFIAKKGAFALIGSILNKPIRIKTMSMGEIAFAVFKSKFNQMGRILDISMGGIALCYIDSNRRPKRTSELAILLAEDRFYIYNMPFEIISDFEIADEFATSALKMRTLSLHFKDLTHRQISRLDFFIKNHTIGAK